MSTPRLARCASICLGWLVATAMTFHSVAGTPITGSLYYTRDGGPATVASISFRYDGTNNFQVISNAVIASLPSADGLLIAPDGDLLVGDCNDSGTLYKVNPFTGTVVSAPSNGGACHLSLDVDRTRAWAGDTYGTKISPLSEVPLHPFGPGVQRSVTNATTGQPQGIGTIVWDGNGRAFFTASPANTPGTFGSLTLTGAVFSATPLLTGLPAAHGMAYDPYSGLFVLFGINHVTLVSADDAHATVVSDRTFNPGQGHYDQGSVDGLGHIYAAHTSGTLTFIDYSQTRLLTGPSVFATNVVVDTQLDDVAPVLFPGSTNVANLIVDVGTASALPASPRPASTEDAVPPSPRADFTYTVTISNAGPAKATAIQLSTQVPGNLRVISVAASLATAGTTLSNSTLTCTAPTLEAGGAFTLDLVVRPQGGAWSTRWIATSAETDPNFADNFAEQHLVSPYDAAPAPAGMISWWPGERDATDHAGHSDGFFTHPAYAPGMVGEAFAFDGSTTVITVPDSASLHPASLTAECWVNFSSVSGTRVILAKPRGSGTGDSFALWLGSSALHAASSQGTVNYNLLPTPGTWYHLAMTANSSSVMLYLNGDLVASNRFSGAIVYDTHPVLIGGDSDNGSVALRFWGLVDEPALYNRVLTADEIRSIYFAGTAGKQRSPAIVPVALDDGVTNRAYTATLALAGGFSPAAFSVASGTLPPGLDLSPQGMISGVPTSLGSFPFTLRGVDGAGSNVLGAFTLNVVPSQPRPRGMISWWRGEGSGSDELGHHNGGAGGSVGYVRGHTGQAFAFSGGSYIGTGGWVPGARWTVEAWVNPSLLKSGRACIAGGFADSFPWGITLQDGQFTAQYRGPSGAAAVLSGVWAVPGVWYHVAGTCDGLNARVYVNGTLRNTEPVAPNFIGTKSGTRIGTSVSNPSNDAYTGLVDEVAVYNRALSDDEILQLYQAGAGGKVPGGGAPAAPTLSGNATAGPGDSVVFQATVTDSPLVEGLLWYHNDVPMDSATTGTLTLTQLAPAAAGTYTVAAENSAGVTFASAPALLGLVAMLPSSNATARISLYGPTGHTNRVEYRDTQIARPGWILWTNLVLPASPFTLEDPRSPAPSSRFYRVTLP